MSALSFAFAKKHRILLQREGDQAGLITSRPISWPAILEIQRHFGTLPEIQLVEGQQLQNLLEDNYSGGDTSDSGALDELVPDLHELEQLADAIPAEADLLDLVDEVPVVRLINGLFAEALNRGASDIHIEVYERDLAIRLRVDGVLQEVLSPDYRLAPLIVSRIKVMAKLDIAEKRIPQDGRITVRIAGRPVDVRVSTLPAAYGERVVMRVLDKRQARLDLSSLGMPDKQLEEFRELLAHPNGIILVTGPTGSGKTTTLYAGLQMLNSKERNILTVEDPIEYALEGVGQTQVNTKTGMTFAKGLRAMLRQDPDVVLVGEIRDHETAEIAVQASLTGHLVLSTLHTNDAVGAITRMLDIGVEPFLLSSALKGVLAQRLVRRLCLDCRAESSLSETEARLLGDSSIANTKCYMPVGCDLCNHTGYNGRIGIYELLVITPQLRAWIDRAAREGSSDPVLGDHHQGLLTQGRQLVLEGITSAEELLRSARGC